MMEVWGRRTAYVLMTKAKYYYSGAKNFPVDYAMAVSLWNCIVLDKTSTIRGRSYNRLAYAYRFGRGVPQSWIKAFKLWELGAQAGDTLAMSSYGKFCTRQHSNVCNYDTAEKWLKVAVTRNHRPAIQYLERIQTLLADTKSTFDF